jgi:hypothetical protein
VRLDERGARTFPGEALMKKTLLAPIVALLALVATAAPVAAVPVGPLAVTTSSLSIAASYSCAQVPITWYLTSAPAGVDTWSIDGDIVDSAGASRGWIFEYEQLPVTQAGDTFDICGLAEGANTYTVAADVDAWTPDFDMYSTRFTATLTITRTTPPPPPPPPPAATSVRFDGRPAWFKKKTHARMGALVEVKSSCSGERSITLSARRSGAWKPLRRVAGYSSAYIKARVPYKYKQVRLEVAATPACLGATSRAVSVPKKPQR